MTKKSKVTTSIEFKNGETVELFDTYFLDNNSMIVKEKGKPHEHHHFYYDKTGKHCSHKKNEKTSQITPTNTNICNLRFDLLKKKEDEKKR